jgi:hypothetical protein
LQRIPEQVSFSEVAAGVAVPPSNSPAAKTGTFDASEVELDRNIRSLMAQDGLSYADAYKALRAQQSITI